MSFVFINFNKFLRIVCKYFKRANWHFTHTLACSLSFKNSVDIVFYAISFCNYHFLNNTILNIKDVQFVRFLVIIDNMKYQVFALVLIALAAVPSDAFLCFASTASPKISIFNVPGIELCPLGSRCISYRFEVNGFPTRYMRGCMAIPEGTMIFANSLKNMGQTNATRVVRPSATGARFPCLNQRALRAKTLPPRWKNYASNY